jgi:hypothetical protein
MRTRIWATAIGLVCATLAGGAGATPSSPSSPAGAAPTSTSLVVKIPSGTSVTSVRDPELARALLVKHAAVPAHVTLEAESRVDLSLATVHRFRQVHLGVPVFARGAGVALDAHGNVILATSKLEDALPSDVTPTLGAADAASIATGHTGVPAGADGAQLMIVPMPDGARLAWMVVAPAQLPELYAPLVVVDAKTGAVLSVVNTVRFLKRAKVFPTNPVVDKGITSEVTLAIPSGTSTPENADLVSWNCVDRGTVLTTTGTKGTRQTHVCDLEKAAPEATSGDFLQYDSAPDAQGGDPFAALQIFYHANRAFEYFRSFSGNGGFKLVDVDQPLSLVANWMSGARIAGAGDAGVADAASEGGVDAADEAGGADAGDAGDAGLPALQPYQNAAYVPYVAGATFGQSLPVLYPDKIKGGVLQFGQGKAADYSYDGEVVYHEFTHAVVNATIQLVGNWHLDAQGGTASPGAMNEGLADFFSSSISGQSAVGTYAVKDMQMAGLTSIRDLANANTCPKDMVGEVHADSLFFTGALWKVRSGLGSDADKKRFTETMFTVMTTIKSGDLGYEDLANAFVTALATTMGTATSKAMSDEFAARGVTPQCDRVIEWAGKPLRGTDPLSSYTLTSPGTINYLATLTYAPSFYQVKIPLSAGQNKVTSSFRAMASGFGGSTGFQPYYLIGYDAPVTYKGTKASSTTLVPVTAESTGDAGVATGTLTTYSASFDVPDGVSAAYVMLVNKGQSDGLFLDQTFSIDNTPGETGPADPDAGVDAATNQDSPTGNAAGGGCSCETSARASAAPFALASAMAALAWLARRRRRN